MSKGHNKKLYPMKLQTMFTKFNLRTISAAICVSLVSSCAYETYPVSSYHNGSPYGTPYGTPYEAPYGNTHTVSDPTIPLILGASAVGALAYYSKKNHDDRHHSSHHYSHGYRNNHYSNHHVQHNSYRNNHTRSYQPHYNRTNHSSNYCPSNHYSRPTHTSYDRGRDSVRDSYRNSAREALERKRETQYHQNRSRPQVNQPHHSQVVSHREEVSRFQPNRSGHNQSNHSGYNRNSDSARDSFRNSAREAIERRRETPQYENRSRPQVSQPQPSQVVSRGSSHREHTPQANIQTRINLAEAREQHSQSSNRFRSRN